MQLNPQQEDAANHQYGPCLVVAVPGSGKTRVLVERTIRLIEKGIEPKDIISLTFTNKAANEMKERIVKRLGKKDLRMFVGTFHSLCAKILRQYGSLVGLTKDFSIIDDGDQKSLVEKITKKLHPNFADDIKAWDILYVTNTMRENLANLSEDYADLFMPYCDKDASMAIKYEEISREYLKTLKDMNSTDFSGLLYEAITILNTHEKPRDFMQGCHQYLQVDETQDTNFAQFQIIDILSKKHNNVFVVADLDQSIYSWRGARYQNISDFITKSKDCKIYQLGYNYRSTPQIMEVAGKLIKHNTERMENKYIVVNPPGDIVSYKSYGTPEDEAKNIAYRVLDLTNLSDFSFKNCAVLYRTNFMSRSLEEAFVRQGIPYKVIGGFSFYDRSEIKDCLAMLRLFANRKDFVAFHRVIGLLKGVGIKSQDYIEQKYYSDKTDLIRATISCSQDLNKKCQESIEKFVLAYNVDEQGKNAAQILMHIIKTLDYERTLRNSKRTEVEERVENVIELIHSINSDENKEMSVSEYLQKISLISSADEKAEKDQVTLMTLHAAKGLEFPIVFIVGVEKDLLPHIRSLEEGSEEEERRLFYVGITRAEKKLHISSCQRRPMGYGRDVRYKSCCPSPFLKQAGLIR